MPTWFHTPGCLVLGDHNYHTIVVIQVIRNFLYSSSVYSCYLFLISSAYIRSLLFLSLIVSIFAWNVPLVSLIFLKRSLVFPILLFPCIYLHWSLVSCLSSIFFGTHIQLGIFPFLFFLSLLFLAVCKASSDNHFAFLHFCFFGMVLITVSCTMLQTSIHSSSGSLFIRSNHLNLFVTSTV